MRAGPENEPLANDGEHERGPDTESEVRMRSLDKPTAVLLILGIFALIVIIVVVSGSQADDEESTDAADMDRGDTTIAGTDGPGSFQLTVRSSSGEWDVSLTVEQLS